MFKRLFRRNEVRDAKVLGNQRSYEDMFKTNTLRYTDPLVRDNVQDIQNPVHRERVAYEDPLARMFIWDAQLRAWDEYPKFYVSDQLDAPEIMQDVRALLMDLKIHQSAIVQGVLKQVHGWATTICNIAIDKSKMDVILDYDIFSERQCFPQNVNRQGKTVIGWQVQQYPQLPLQRVPMNANLDQVYVPRNKPNIIYDTRGEELTSWGFGYSRLEHIWDALTKLRLESDADSFRKAIFPMAIYPPDWQPDDVDKFFEKMSKLSRTTATAYPAAKDQDGKLYDTIPSLTFMSPSDDIKQTGSGQFGGLSAEWTRLLGGVKHSMGYVVGGGAISASQSAAGVDLDDDLKSDIAEWNLINKGFIRKFLEFLELKGLIPPLPPTFTIKCAWQWKHDEMMMQQALMAENQILTDETSAQSEQEAKENRAIENGLMDVLKTLIGKKSSDLELQPKEYKTDIEAILDLPKYDSQGIELNKWLPVNSSSGNMEGVLLDMGDEGTAPTIYGSFGGGNIYAVQDPEMIANPIETVKKIMAQGGDAWWEEIRASKAERSGYEKGKAPKGSAKTGGGKFAYAGRAHMTDYVKVAGSRTPVKQQQREKKKEMKKSSPAKSKPGMFSKLLQSKGKSILRGALAETKKMTSNDHYHPILQRANSVSEAVRAGFEWQGQTYHSKSKAYEILNAVREELRQNAMLMGNSFSTKNPFKYADETAPLGYVVEYQCPESIKSLVGSKWPMWIDHRGDRSNDEFIGTYEITGYDEEQGIEIANYEIDWDAVDSWFELNNESNFTLDENGNRIIPDTSTEYICNIKYDKDRNIFIQTDFQLHGVALVPRGNCSSGFCGLSPENRD